MEWDESLRKPKVEAKLVSARRSFAHMRGLDIALLKLPPGDYEPIPLTPLFDVEVGDRVVTLGFPLRGAFPGISLTVSTGEVSRFNRGADGEVMSIFTTATITHGNSGGPCVSLVTGGVIGLNTFDPRVASEHADDYYGLVPIDKCLRAFPLVARLGVSYDAQELDFADCYGLASLFTRQGSHAAAGRLARRAVELQPDLADAHCLRGTCGVMWAIERLPRMESEDRRRLVAAIQQDFQRALAIDPGHKESLLGMAGLYLHVGQLDQAAAAARQAIQAKPDFWDTHYLAGQIALVQGKHDEALAHAQKSKDVASGFFPQPAILAGTICYAKGGYEAGKRHFEQAAAIHPLSLEARLGVGRYFELKKDIEAAVRTYRAMLSEFAHHPAIYARIGSCYFEAQRYDEALEPLWRSRKRSEELWEPPIADVLLGLAQIHEKKDRADRAINAYAQFVHYHEHHELAPNVHVGLASCWAQNNRHGLACAHLRQARALNPDHPEIKKLDANVFQLGLAIEEIKLMVGLEYPLPLAVRLVRDTGRTIEITEETAPRVIAELRDKHRLPPPLIAAILQAPYRGRRPRGIVGVWVATIQNPQMGMAMENIVVLQPDGRFVSIMLAAGVEQQRIEGQYEFDGKTLKGRSTMGQEFEYPCALQQEGGDDVLIMTLPGIGPTRFVRQNRDAGGP